MARLSRYFFTASIALALVGPTLASDSGDEKLRLLINRDSGSQSIEFQSDGETVALQFDFAVENPGRVKYQCGVKLPESHVANCFVREEEGLIRVLVYSGDNSILADATLLEVRGAQGISRPRANSGAREGRASIGRADLLRNGGAASAKQSSPVSGVVLSDANGKEVGLN